jgi:5'-nucleotidase
VEIVGTSDLHGHVAPEKWSAEGHAREGGGLALLGGYLKILRQRPNPVLLLDSGDLFQGTLESNISHGRAVITGYNALGYQAAVLGNHEFDFGAESPDPDSLAAIRHRVSEAKFPFLAANVLVSATQKPIPWPNVKASVMVDLHGTKVGVIGVSHPDTPSVTLPGNVADLEFLPPTPVIKELAEKLRADGAQLVVLAAHFGGECKVRGAHASEDSCDDGVMRKVLHELPYGTVDVALAGHTHQFMANWIAGTPTVEAGFAGRDFSWVTACVKPKGGLDPKTSTLHAPVPVLTNGKFLGKKVVPDAEVQSAIQNFLARVAEETARPLGPVLPTALVRDYNSPSSLGTVTAEALKHFTGADVAVINSGGLRADLPKGPLTFGALYRALPFENRAVVIQVTGRQMLALLNALPQSGHGYPQVAGLTASGDAGDWTGGTLGDGKPLELDHPYRLATVDFLASGGDGMKSTLTLLPSGAVQEPTSELVLRDIVLRYLKSKDTPDAGK